MLTILFILILIISLQLVKMHVYDFVSKIATLIFLGYFLGSMIISTFNPNEFFPVSFWTYMVFLTGTLSFFIGFLSLSIRKKKEYIDLGYLSHSVDRVSKSLIILILIGGFCIFSYPYVIKALAIAAVQGGAEMANKDEVIFGGESLITIMYNIGMAIMSRVAMVVLASSFILPGWKKRIPVILASVLLQLFYVVLSGGRGTLLAIIMALVFVYICFHANDKSIKISRKQGVIFILLFTVIFSGMTMITSYRGTGEFSIQKNERSEAMESMGLSFLNYTVVPLNLLDISFKENYVEKLRGFRYGKATFSGVDYLIQSIAKRCGIPYKTDLYIVEYLQDNRKECARNREYNYAYSMFFFNYMDFGILGVIIIPFIFGLSFRWVVRRFYEDPCFSRLLMVVLFFNMMFLSHFTSPFIRPWDMFLMIMLFVWDWYRRQRRVAREQ